MILVILGVSLLILVIGIFLYTKFGDYLYANDHEWIYYTLNVAGGTLTVISLIATLGLGVSLSGVMVVDDKIAVYQEENAIIETEISTIVKNYKDYEQGVFDDLKIENPTVLVSLYPELKSDTLVGKQIEIYATNNQKIKELKEQRLDYKPIAWWLYFGD